MSYLWTFIQHQIFPSLSDADNRNILYLLVFMDIHMTFNFAQLFYVEIYYFNRTFFNLLQTDF